MNLLIIGDVVGQRGCDFLRQTLSPLKRQKQVDIVICNGENSAQGNGILPGSAQHLLDSGVDIITTGNHVFKRWEIQDYLEEDHPVIRPANFSDACPGKGYTLYDGGRFQLCVINVQGVTYMEPLANPFTAVDRILQSVKADYYVVDFHAEATGEKKAMGYYLDGRVSCVVGTHTHVQTADAQILPQGTGYITDLGMTGAVYSALGVKPECVIRRLTTAMPTRFEASDAACALQGVLVSIEDKTGRCTKIETIHVE